MVYATQAGHTATLLPSGDVLVAGGSDDWGNLAVAQAYSPATGRWRRVNDLRTDRFQHIAAPLPGGRVLVAGGTRTVPYGRLKSAEIYTP
jgi:hypothetical protein